MKKLILTSVLTIFMIQTATYGGDKVYDGEFYMNINVVEVDVFEVDEGGVGLMDSKIIATVHLNPDSIIYFYFKDPEEFYYSEVFGEKLILDNYGDSVKIQLPLGPGYNCNDVFRTIVCYLDPAGKFKERILLCTDDFKVIDYVRNPDCIAAYEEYMRAMAIDTPKGAEDDKSVDVYFDLSGRMLVAPPAKGIYIHNGKKMVAK